MPDGSSIQLVNAPATDTSGYAGLADKVDYHSLRLLQGVAISTLLSVGANLTISGESDLVRALREAAQQNVSRVGEQSSGAADDPHPSRNAGTIAGSPRSRPSCMERMGAAYG